MENNARLLLLSGNSLCFTFLASKALKGRAVELARLVVFMVLVCEKDLYCMDWVVRMMQKPIAPRLSPPAGRRAWRDSPPELRGEFLPFTAPSPPGHRAEEDSSFLNLSHLLNAQADFHKEILSLAMGSSSS
ncbi:hypothetical protein DV515_00016571 [Chloebia gouldiae]|uniref:Uncharacterized protein n=1 Tax=Chloebia gouldiae TaxID=44316 RepID=A0A3L8RSJ5_CHLGU|nr:hypothetical protein DV515_00016571 [Chloebia gouldiae]